MKKFICLFLLFSGICFSQEKLKPNNVVRWEVTYTFDEHNVNDITLYITATIEKDWHIYSQKVSSDGPVPTSFTFNKDSLKFSLVGNVEEPAGEKKFDAAFDAEIVSFSGTVAFTQKIKRIDHNSIKISGTVEYMTCNNMQCYPPKQVPFSIVIP